jgi:carbon monoxide dehydrogenase subunit G
MEMRFNGAFDVKLPRTEVFEVLSDPRKFTPMLPNFHGMEMKDEKTANVRVKVGIGKIRGTASTDLTLVEANPPLRARYTGNGKVMQSAYQLSYTFDLEDAPGGGTRINWVGDTELAGKILSLAGSSLEGYGHGSAST